MNFVDIETAKTARGVRLVASAIVPSPWSEAAKALFAIGAIPFVVVRAMPRDPAIAAWTQAHNVPVVFHDDDPPRTNWAQILALAARLAPALLPADVDERASTTGLIYEIAGEDGLGWNARLLMIDASLRSDGARGFPLPAAKYLATKYGYSADRMADARTRSIAILDALALRLGDREYYGGDAPNALDAFSATFLTPTQPIPEAECPNLTAPLRAAFATAAEELGPNVAPAMVAHRRRMFERHLGWPIQI